VTERLEAMFTSERFLSAVKATVLSEVMFVLEGFVTDWTDEWPLTCRHHNNQHAALVQQLHFNAISNTD